MNKTWHFDSILVMAAWLISTPIAFAQNPSAPDLRIGILGDPVHQVAWTDEALEKLKKIGFNAVQINLGWGSRPFGEPLNLIDVVTVPGEVELPDTAKWRSELKRRVILAKQHGLRTLFLFGSPYTNRNPITGAVSRGTRNIDYVTFDSWYDVRNPRVRDHEVALLREFRRQFPDVDDILVYTYDNDAWQTPEFQYTQFSYGIPLAERLRGYLVALHQVWTEGRAGKARLWWEPWELSAGQVYEILPKLPRADFGLIIHANIAEAQLTMPVDVWFRNTVRMCRDLGIPVVAESFFAAATEEIEPLSIPAPRLVDEAYSAFMGVPGVAGIKEYYGINASAADLDMDLLQARLHNPSRTTDELLADITSRFGVAQADVQKYLGLIADALQTYPWDASWRAREVGRAATDHGWQGATILGWMCCTPSWGATRHAKFMKTDNAQPHFWMLEDVELRCKLAAELLDRAQVTYGKMAGELATPMDKAQFAQIQQDVDLFRRVSRSYALHLRETNVAQMLREDVAAGRPITTALKEELGRLLDADAANQGGLGRVMEMRRLYVQNPKLFIQRYLVPAIGAGVIQTSLGPVNAQDAMPGEKGDFTLTTR